MKLFVQYSYLQQDTISNEFFLLLVTVITGKGLPQRGGKAILSSKAGMSEREQSGTYCTDIDFNLIMMINLCIFQLSNELLIIRTSAVELIDWLCERYFRIERNTHFKFTLFQSVHDESIQQIYAFTKFFANLHKEIQFDIYQDVFYRWPLLSNAKQQILLIYLTGWIDHLDLALYERDIQIQLIKQFILFTVNYYYLNINQMNLLVNNNIHRFPSSSTASSSFPISPSFSAATSSSSSSSVLFNFWNAFINHRNNIYILLDFLISDILERVITSFPFIPFSPSLTPSSSLSRSLPSFHLYLFLLFPLSICLVDPSSIY